MAKQKRKPASKPITAHQLFPAVVALWFGALFGLGSLAVRPSLLESVVIAAATPPLGVTARILLALGLAALGAILGLLIARRLARPKPEVRERKRTKLAEHEQAAPRYNHNPDADEDEDEMGGGILAQRRRGLAIEPDEEEFVPHEMAPLPGGAPQILDILKVGFDAPAGNAPLDLGNCQAEPERQEFQPQPAPRPEPIAPMPQAVTDPAPAAPTRQLFGQPVEGDHISPDFVREAGFRTSVFETDTPDRLFSPRVTQPASSQAAAPFAPPPANPALPVEHDAVPPMATAPFAQPVASPAVVPTPVAPVAMPVTAPAEPLPSPATLGMTDLASRLAESMARRRAARAALNAAAPLVTEAPQAQSVAEAAPAQSPFAAPERLIAAPAEPTPAMPAPSGTPQPPSAPRPATLEPAAPAVPAAMRPLDLGGFEEEFEPLSSLLPPRHIAMPAAAPIAPPEPASFAIHQAAQPEPLEAVRAVSEDSAAEELAGEDRFGSLLGVPIQPVGPRAGLVRIEEPETETAEIEPVVIFPGQMTRPTLEEAAPFRRFDAPANAEQGQPVAAGQVGPTVDREEAERALRMALANLQRMSGAA